MSLKKELTMKTAAEIFKLASRIGIKPKDIIGVGGDIVKMGKSLFNTKVNPKLTEFISKKGEVPTKIIEDLKIHLRSLKNASDNQVELFKLNLKDIVNAKFPPANVVKLDISSKLPVSGIKRPGASVAEEMAIVESQMGNIKKTSSKLDDVIKEYEAGYKPRGPEFGSREYYISEIKRASPTTQLTGKESLQELKKIMYNLDEFNIPFSDGGVAKLNAELNQLPEYYLPMSDGGIANHFRKK